MERFMKTGVMAMTLVLAAVVAGELAAEAARPGNTVNRARQSRVRAEVRIHADTLVQQTLVAIRRDSQDGQWLMASSGPLLDRFRGEETAVVLPDTVIRAIRAVTPMFTDAGLTLTDTITRVLGRRILRATVMEEYSRAGWIRRDGTGAWVVDESAAEGNLDAEFARIRVEEERADRMAMTAEIERQSAPPPPRSGFGWFTRR